MSHSVVSSHWIGVFFAGWETTADKHESPHFANLYDMALKYCDVIPVAEVLTYLGGLPANRG